jgi:hypothetical protein
VTSFNRTIQIYFGAFTPIHWGFNPWVTPDRSNGCQVFQPRSDRSDWFLPVHSSMTPWTWKNRWSRYSHGPWGSTVLISSLPKSTQRSQMVRRLTPYFLLPNLTVMNDHRLPDRISFVDHHLSRLRHLTFQLLPLI